MILCRVSPPPLLSNAAFSTSLRRSFLVCRVRTSAYLYQHAVLGRSGHPFQCHSHSRIPPPPEGDLRLRTPRLPRIFGARKDQLGILPYRLLVMPTVYHVVC
jgi:hypothetical protein